MMKPEVEFRRLHNYWLVWIVYKLDEIMYQRKEVLLILETICLRNMRTATGLLKEAA